MKPDDAGRTTGPAISPARLRARIVMRGVGRAGRVVYRAVNRFFADDGLYMASALAFSLLLAIFPFILFLTAIAGVVGGYDLAAFLTVTLFDALPNQVAAALEPEIWNVLIRDRGGGIITFGVAIMLVSVTSAIETIRGGLNRAYGVFEKRLFLRTALESAAFIVMATVGLIVVAFLAVGVPVVYTFLANHVPEALVPWDIFVLLRGAMLALVLATLLWAFHRWLPAHGERRPALWPGILLTLVLWYVSGKAFTWYLSAFADYARYYAGLAGIVAAMLFFYIAAVILLFAGAFNRAVHDFREERRAARELTQG